MKKATLGQRFLALIIDTIIILVVGLGIIFGIQKAKIIERPTLDKEIPADLVEPLSDYIYFSTGVNIEKQNNNFYLIIGYSDEASLLEFIENNSNRYGDITDQEVLIVYEKCKAFAQEYVYYYTSIVFLFTAICFAMFIIYYCVIGYLWKHQTIGRLLAGIKVITQDGQRVGLFRLILRDGVGFYLLNLLMSCCFAPLIFNIVFLTGVDKMSLGDKISGTMMVVCDKSGKPIKDDVFNSNNPFVHNFYEDGVVTQKKEDTEEVNIDDKKDETIDNEKKE